MDTPMMTNSPSRNRSRKLPQVHRLRAALAVWTATVGSLACPSHVDAAPAGSYAQTCSVRSFTGSVLVATCKDFSGRWAAPSTLDVAGCVGDIFNSGGRLTCSRATPPAGTFQSSCSDIGVDANRRLNAQCRRMDGRMIATALDTRPCRGDIANIDGHLTCDKGGTPPGSYLRTCWDVVTDGTDLSAVCRTSGGGNSGRTAMHAYGASCLDQGGEIVNQEGSLQCQMPVHKFPGCNPMRGDPGCIGGTGPWPRAASATIKVIPHRPSFEKFDK